MIIRVRQLLEPKIATRRWQRFENLFAGDRVGSGTRGGSTQTDVLSFWFLVIPYLVLEEDSFRGRLHHSSCVGLCLLPFASRGHRMAAVIPFLW